MALPNIGAGGIVKDIYGNDANNAISYNLPLIPTPAPGQRLKIFGDSAQILAEIAVAEHARRGASPVTIPNDYFTGKIFASKFQFIKTTVEVPGPIESQAYNTNYGGGSNAGNPPAVTTFSQVPAPSGATNFVRGAKITSTIINALISEINTAGTVCTCNCNYCTCNCNYCTCNCNYSCTCNCNYSDELVKSEVEYL